MSMNVKKELKHLLKNWISPSRAAKSIWITVAPGFTYLRRVGSCFFSCSRLRTWSNLKHQHQYLSGILLLSMHHLFIIYQGTFILPLYTYLWNEYLLTSSMQNSVPLTELDISSTGGDHRQIPITFGTMTSMPPLIPDCDGKPTFLSK